MPIASFCTMTCAEGGFHKFLQEVEGVNVTDEAYARIERLFDGPYCELFSRNTRAGWSSWGNEVGKLPN